MTSSPDGSTWEAALAALAEAQARTEERLAALTERVDALTEQMAALASHVQRLADQGVESEARVQRLTDQVGEVKGWAWEWRYQLHAPTYFGRILRRIQVLAPERLAALLDDAVAASRLSEAEADEVERADLICRGRRTDDNTSAYLVIEVSAGVGPQDVERAARRAALLARTGTPALAAVAGQRLTPKAHETARQLGVWQVRDGTASAPGPPR